MGQDSRETSRSEMRIGASYDPSRCSFKSRTEWSSCSGAYLYSVCGDKISFSIADWASPKKSRSAQIDLGVINDEGL